MVSQNLYFPIWISFLFPPTFFFVIIGVIALNTLFCYFLCKKNKFDFKKIIRNNLLKLVGINLISYIGIALVLLLPSFFKTSNFTNALEWNPYSHFGSFIYLFLSIILGGIIIYFLNLKFNIKLFTKRKKIMNKALIILALITAPYLYLIPTVLIFDTLKSKRSFTKQEVLTTYIARYNNKISFSKNDFDNAFRMINELITDDEELAASLTYTYEKRRIIINLNNNIVEEEKLEKIALMVMITNSKIEEIIYVIDINNEIRFKRSDFEKEFNLNFKELSKTEQLESIIFNVPDPIKD